MLVATDLRCTEPNSFSVKDHSQHTIGVEFSSRTVKLGEKRVKLQVRIAFRSCDEYLPIIVQLWDTAGQERFRCVHCYKRGF